MSELDYDGVFFYGVLFLCVIKNFFWIIYIFIGLVYLWIKSFWFSDIFESDINYIWKLIYKLKIYYY